MRKLGEATLRLLAGGLALIFLCMGAVGCGDTGEEADRVTAVTDVLGRSVAIPQEPLRVAALLGSLADLWQLAGGELCAAAEDAWEDFALSLDGVAEIGGAHSPSTERLIAAEPNLVLASASTASHLELRQPLEAMGIAVLYFDIDNFEDYLQALSLCTDLTGRVDLYEANGLALKQRIEQIKALYRESHPNERAHRVLLLRASASAVKTKGSEGTVLGEMLADLGCINIADGEGSLLDRLSVEAVIREEPSHIFVVTMGDDTEGARASVEQMLKEDPAWGGLEAVRENRVHVMDKRLFNLKPNLRWADAYEILYQILTEA